MIPKISKMWNQFAVQGYRTFPCNQEWFRVLVDSRDQSQRLDTQNASCLFSQWLRVQNRGKACLAREKG